MKLFKGTVVSNEVKPGVSEFEYFIKIKLKKPFNLNDQVVVTESDIHGFADAVQALLDGHKVHANSELIKDYLKAMGYHEGGYNEYY